ncbi:MAG: hypothetical protein Cons2KO_08750 [Congregibacter sp.]
MKALKKIVVSTALIGLVSGFGMQANAGSVTEVTASSVTEPTQVTVNYTDLDLTSPAGQAVLYSRISNAAEKVCGAADLRRAGSLAQASRNEDCYRESLSRALSKVNETVVATTN